MADTRLRLMIEGIDRSGAAISAVAGGLNRIGQATERLRAGFARLSAAGDKMVSVGFQMSMVGAGLAGAAIYPVKQAADFERAMSGVRAVTTGAEENFESLTRVATELGKATEFTTTQVAGGLKFLGMAGLDAKQAIDAIRPSLLLAGAGMLELGEAADIATNVMTTFGMKATDITHIGDVLAQTAASTNTDIRQMAEAMVYAGPAAAAAGVKMEELAGMIGVLANRGMKASMAGTTLRGIMIALAAPTKQAEKALDALGVQIEYNEDGTVDYHTTLKALGEANMGLAEATAIFRRTAAGGALQIAKNTVELDKLTRANLNADGAMEKMYKTMTDNLIGALVKVKSSFEVLNATLGAPLIQPLTEALLAVVDFLNVATQWVERNKELTTTILSIVGGLGAFMAIIGAVLIPMGLLLKLVATAGTGLLSLGKAVGFFALALKQMNTYLPGAAAGFGVLRASIVGVTSVVFAAVEAFRLFKVILQWKEAAQQAAEAQGRLSTVTALLRAKIRKFNEETGESVKGSQELVKVAREKGWVLDKETNKWVKLADQVEKSTKRIKKAQVRDPRIVERELQVISETENMRIALMAEGILKLEELRDKEIADFYAAEDSKGIAFEVVQQRIAMIRQKYSQEIAEIGREATEESIKQMEREVEEAERQLEKKLAAQKRFAAATEDMRISLIKEGTDKIDALHVQEIERTRAEGIEKGIVEEEIQERLTLIDKKYADVRLAYQKDVADQEAQLQQQRLWNARTIAASMSELFSNLQQIYGEKSKTLFRLQKAAAIAEATINTITAATRALREGGPIMGPAMAAVITALGMSKVALISAQSFAKGGLALGKKGKDSILARLTNKEYVMQPSAVEHYGTRFMEAVNRKLVALQNVNLPNLSVSMPRTGRFATGGLAVAGAGAEVSNELTFVNITDPRDIDRFLASAQGQNAVLNVISTRAPAVKRLLR